MAMRAEDKRYSSQERTIKDLSPNVAALLCYVAGWISGIMFLVLEQKNRYVRFHALQSIIIFGSLTLAGVVFGHIPVIGPGFSAIFGITGFILWIILMVKAIGGDMFKMSWAGNLAERLANESIPPQAQPPVNSGEAAGYETGKTEELYTVKNAEQSQRSTRQAWRDETFSDRYYSFSHKTGRLVSSAFSIAWSVALLIFFNFYNQYIAWYEPIHSGNTTRWQMHTLVTSDFNTWLPVVTAALMLSIIGHAVVITFDKYVFRQIVRTVLDVFGDISVITLLAIFPFNFSLLPSTTAADGVTLGLTIGLIFMAVCFGISALVNFIQLIVHSVRGEY
jgi:uncharacterized membrane protein